jgi:hypothetical protein
VITTWLQACMHHAGQQNCLISLPCAR